MKLTYSKRDGDEMHVLGTVTLPDSTYPSANIVYFCSDCGKSWGQVSREGCRTWRMHYRSCGCLLHDALSAFEPGLFQTSPYVSTLWTDWSNAFPLWPESLLRIELLRLISNLETPRFYDSLLRNLP
jgi:hypothetical protein